MTNTSPPAGWYPDPAGGGGKRYWDGAAWTEHFVPPPPGPPLYPAAPAYPPAGGVAVATAPGMPAGWALQWKGAQLGRPFAGPGALASPGRRLGARLLDGLVLLPLFVLLLVVTLLIAAPHFGPILPPLTTNNSTTQPLPAGFWWLELTFICVAFATGLFSVLYESIMTARYGRTLGKRWVHIRPLRRDGSTLSFGRALGRVSIYWLFGVLSWVGLIDVLFCTWDDQRQCLHDKVADTIVVNDPL